MPNPISGLPGAAVQNESLARVSQNDGTRRYTAFPDAQSAPLCDADGRLIVRIADAGGFQSPTGATSYGMQIESGSAPAKDNLGLVTLAKVLEHPLSFDPATLNGVLTTGRMFGFSTLAGFVQLIRKDESAGVAPPVVTDVPEVVIPIGAGQNFSFGQYVSGMGPYHSLYIALSTTGPTFTPAAAGMWFYHFGSI